MRTFNYSKIKEEKWDSEILSLIAAIYKEAGKYGGGTDAHRVWLWNLLHGFLLKLSYI